MDQTILTMVAEAGAKRGFTVERSEIVHALSELIEDGLAAAYILSRTEPATELQGMPSLDIAEEDLKTYFFRTERDWISNSPTPRGLTMKAN